MNYVGSISILDRGDAPAQAVIDRNARSMAQRVADDTKDELQKVMTRVETIYSTFDDTEQGYSASNLEYIQDIGELEEIMKDQVKKKKYQHQVTIFIVGFEKVSVRRLQLIQQVNEFFVENTKKTEEEDLPTTPDIDLEEVGSKVEESLEVAQVLAKRLGDLNKEMVDYLANYTEKKASNKGKKKMEKAMQQAKEELLALAEKLQSVQTDLVDKDEKLQSTFKQLEAKNLEVQKYRTAAELAKQKISVMQKELDEQKQISEHIKKDLSQFHDEQLSQLREVHQQDMEDMKKQHAEQIKSLSGVSDSQSEAGRQLDLQSEDGASRQSSKQESRPSTKGRTSGLKKGSGKAVGKEGKGGKSGSSGSSLASDDLDRDFTLDDLEFTQGEDGADMATQDEGGEVGSSLAEDQQRQVPATRHRRRSRSTLAPVEEFEDQDGTWNIDEEQAWSTVPKDQLEGRFAQYRRICRRKLQEVEEQRQLTVAKTQRKVQLLKSQFVEHKTKWETERKVLISQIEQAQQQQMDAEKEADQAMTQLEDFITQQERLEEEEEARRSAILRGASGSSLTPPAPLTPHTPTPSAPKTPLHPSTPGMSARPTPLDSRSTRRSSEELHSLMQQTDDAKELRVRLMGTKSAPPGVDVTTVAAQGQVTPEAEAGAQETTISEDMDRRLTPAEGGGNQQTPVLEELQDLPPIDGSLDDAASTPSLQPPPTATTIGATPTHDQLPTPFSDVDTASSDPSDPKRGNNHADTEEIKKEIPDTMAKLGGETSVEELRQASAMSRASLRSNYRKRLSESRQAAEDRRAKSPHIALPANLSVDDELVLDDDDDEDDEEVDAMFDDDMALPDDMKEEMEEARRKELWADKVPPTPPPPSTQQLNALCLRLAAGKWTKLLEHPILEEYLKAYHSVTAFKDTVAKLFLDKDMMSASQIVSDLETLVFETDKKVIPQIEHFTTNIAFILEEIASVINSAVMVDREPPVSSLLPYSRDETRSRLPPTRQMSASTLSTAPLPLPPHPHTTQSQPLEVEPDIIPMETKEGLTLAGSQQGSRKSSVSGSSTKQHLSELQNQYSMLQVRLEDEGRKHQEQLRHNTVVMMEMQDTINDLQRELSAIGKATRKPHSPASASHRTANATSPDQSLMFTRLDLERNAKIMKKAVLDQRLDADRYKDAVSTMDDYVSLPAQRLAHLVKKYVHHSRMKEIEENVKKSHSLDESVFDALDKMEALQNHRAQQWADKMDAMGLERLRLAAMLMESLDSIEQESGLFLIKPMYSYRGRELKAPPTQKLARPVRLQPVSRHQSAARESTTSFIPAPTPASNARRTDRHTPTQMMGNTVSLPPPPPSQPENGIIGSGAITHAQSAPLVQQPYHTWNMSMSQARAPLENMHYSLNTPRMLELDINRMLIGQNNVSTKLPQPPTDDRLVNASNNTLRSYITVQRPAASLSSENRPQSVPQAARDAAGAPPSSPRPPLGVSATDLDIPQTLVTPPPLPPIQGRRSGSALSSHQDDDEDQELPTSPGSYRNQSTTHDLDEGLALQS